MPACRLNNASGHWKSGKKCSIFRGCMQSVSCGARGVCAIFGQLRVHLALSHALALPQGDQFMEFCQAQSVFTPLPPFTSHYTPPPSHDLPSCSCTPACCCGNLTTATSCGMRNFSWHTNDAANVNANAAHSTRTRTHPQIHPSTRMAA